MESQTPRIRYQRPPPQLATSHRTLYSSYDNSNAARASEDSSRRIRQTLETSQPLQTNSAGYGESGYRSPENGASAFPQGLEQDESYNYRSEAAASMHDQNEHDDYRYEDSSLTDPLEGGRQPDGCDLIEQVQLLTSALEQQQQITREATAALQTSNSLLMKLGEKFMEQKAAFEEERAAWERERGTFKTNNYSLLGRMIEPQKRPRESSPSSYSHNPHKRRTMAPTSSAKFVGADTSSPTSDANEAAAPMDIDKSPALYTPPAARNQVPLPQPAGSAVERLSTTPQSAPSTCSIRCAVLVVQDGKTTYQELRIQEILDIISREYSKWQEIAPTKNYKGKGYRYSSNFSEFFPAVNCLVRKVNNSGSTNYGGDMEVACFHCTRDGVPCIRRTDEMEEQWRDEDLETWDGVVLPLAPKYREAGSTTSSAGYYLRVGGLSRLTKTKFLE